MTIGYKLEVVAIDGGVGSERLTGWCRVSVNITDVNNKSPRWLETKSVSVSEDVRVGQLITTLRAEDPDKGSLLRYNMDPELSEARSGEGRLVSLDMYDWRNIFSVDTNTGDVIISERLDREMIQDFELAVTVEDIAADGTERQVATSSIHISVEDVNDNSPKFTEKEYTGYVTENSPRGTKIMRLLAIDADVNNTIKYSLSGGKILIVLK